MIKPDFKTMARLVIDKLLASDSTHEARLEIISNTLKECFDLGIDLAASYVESEIQGQHMANEIKLLKNDLNDSYEVRFKNE